MLSQQHNQANNKGANGEARCFLCLKDTLDEYTFQFEDFCNFIINHFFSFSKKKNFFPI